MDHQRQFVAVPVLVEIETPYKAWFYGDRAEIHSSLAHAHGQRA